MNSKYTQSELMALPLLQFSRLCNAHNVPWLNRDRALTVQALLLAMYGQEESTQ